MKFVFRINDGGEEVGGGGLEKGRKTLRPS